MLDVGCWVLDASVTNPVSGLGDTEAEEKREKERRRM
jgi:hypothetical protein